MCCIVYVEDKRPSEDMVNRMWDRNDDGAGFAWREGGDVVWEKGLTLEESHIYMQDLPTPFIAHFRVASVGGVCPELTHPFPVSMDSTLALTGRTKGFVLFHNGDWREWKDALLKSLPPGGGIKLPPGRQWSDSRAMAWLCSMYGHSYMDLISHKGVIFGPGPEDTHIFSGASGWEEVEGIWCSNDYFKTRKVSHNMTDQYCKFPHCIQKNKDTEGYCPAHFQGKTHEMRMKDIQERNVAASQSGVGNFPHAQGVAMGGATPHPHEHGWGKPLVKDGVTPGVVNAGAGGTQLQQAPFRIGQGQIFTVAQAELMHKSNPRYMSKNAVKKVRKHWEKEAWKAEKARKKEEREMGVLAHLPTKTLSGPTMPSETPPLRSKTVSLSSEGGRVH